MFVDPCIRVQFIKKNPKTCNNVSKFYYCTFIWSSTCFGQHTAHHHEPKPALAVSGFSYVEGCWTCRRWTWSGTVCLTNKKVRKWDYKRKGHKDRTLNFSESHGTARTSWLRARFLILLTQVDLIPNWPSLPSPVDWLAPRYQATGLNSILGPCLLHARICFHGRWLIDMDMSYTRVSRIKVAYRVPHKWRHNFYRPTFSIAVPNFTVRVSSVFAYVVAFGDKSWNY
jgi:hypothetical protein